MGFTKFTTETLRDAVLLGLAIGLFFLAGLGARPYMAPSEARYIELPRQMLATHDWLTPRINGVPYFEKPPLFYWMQASIMHVLGTDETAGRLASVIAVTLTCLLAYATARRLFGRTAGRLAATALATSLLGYGLSRVAGLDATVTLFITGCLASFLAAQTEENAPQRRSYYWLMYACAALAVMTKGLIGIIIPGMVIGAWIAFTGRWRILKECHLIPGTLLFLAIAAPWHVLMAKAHPEFLDFYFIHEHFTRYLTDSHKRNEPWWFFIAITLAGLLPWTGVLLGQHKKFKALLWPVKRAEPVALFLALWVLLPLLFFSLSHSKLVAYIFVIFPPLAVLLGQALATVWANKKPDRLLRLNMLAVSAIFALLILACRLLPHLPGKAGVKLAVLVEIPAAMLGTLAVGVVVLIYAAIARMSPRYCIMLLAMFGAVTGISLNMTAGDLDKSSIKPLMPTLLKELKNDDMIVAYQSYWQDLPVYANRNITVAGWTGELGFGVEHYPETHDWMIGTDELWRRCVRTKHGVYVFITQADLQGLAPHAGCVLRPIGSYGKTTLLQKVD